MQNTSAKNIVFDNDCHENLILGAEQVYRAVSKTMGPDGKLVIYPGSTNLYPNTTKDGVTVAASIALPDPIQQQGAEMLIQAAKRQVNETGDGTTLTIVLAYHMLMKSFKMLNAGSNARELIQEMNSAIKVISDFLERTSKPCTTLDDLKYIANISSNNDKKLGDLIAEAVYNTGFYGRVIWDRGYDSEHTVEYQKGYTLDIGIKRQEFANIEKRFMYWGDNRKPYILVTDEIIRFGEDIEPICMKIMAEASEKKGIDIDDLTIHDIPPLIIISPDVIQHALSVCIRNIQNKKFFIAHIQPEGAIGTKERDFSLRDVAAYTGATFISQESGRRLKDIELSDLGSCEYLHSDPKQTIINGAFGDYNPRLNYLKALIEDKKIEGVELEYAKKSVAKMTGGMAKILVGGSSETEQIESMDRVDDAVHACKSAQEKGYIRGGGVELLRASASLGELLSQRDGYKVINYAIKWPAIQIMMNAHREDCEYIMSRIFNCDTCGYVISESDQPEDCDMLDMGIVDPLKVVINALKNSFSVAKMLIQTAVSITDYTA